MKKHILTVVILFAIVVTNAQEKANHHTTRSNRSNGIIVKDKEEGVDNDCDGVINDNLHELKDGEFISKYSFIIIKNNKYYVNKSKQEDLERCYKKKNQNKVGDAKSAACSGTFLLECDSICGVCMCRIKEDCLNVVFNNEEGGNNELLPLIEISNETKVDKTDLIIKKDNKKYKVTADKSTIQKIRTNKEGDKDWIEILFFNGKSEPKEKKRNKNFNRKGERIKRTNF